MTNPVGNTKGVIDLLVDAGRTPLRTHDRDSISSASSTISTETVTRMREPGTNRSNNAARPGAYHVAPGQQPERLSSFSPSSLTRPDQLASHAPQLASRVPQPPPLPVANPVSHLHNPDSLPVATPYTPRQSSNLFDIVGRCLAELSCCNSSQTLNAVVEHSPAPNRERNQT